MDYALKALVFVPFMALVYLVVDFFLQKVSINAIPALFQPILCQFGILDGLSIFMTIIVTGFLARQALSFAK